jgi:1-acyl-sn-glycerol-3-phosphate acyltransferase
MTRKFLFLLFFFFGISIISVLFLPSLLMPSKIVLLGGKMMGKWASFCLQIFLNTKIVVKGRENIIKNKKFFIACSHQSMFETFYLQTIFYSPIFILKHELIKIPIFGWYLKKIGSISINRNKISKHNLGLIDKIKNSVQISDRPLIIFPQGTRVLPKEKVPFKKGVGRIYDELKINCQPIAINSGNVWPKNGELVPNKIITISILPAVRPGMSSIDFTNHIEEKIYNELKIID